MEQEADICIIGEGSYPYFAGGVSQWVHELITEHQERTFHVITLVPPHCQLKFCYQFPKNVIGHSVYIVQDLPKGNYSIEDPKNSWEILAHTLNGMVTSPDFIDYEPILKLFKEQREILGTRILCESEEIWDVFLKIYQERSLTSPFKSYFATVYTLSRSLYSVLLPRLPKAKLYHAVCTGYAGFLLYRAKKEYNAPCVITEQGIYTNERRIEISMADWISVKGSLNLALEGKSQTLKDFWLNAFLSFARACYVNCDEVISTYDGNHPVQIEGGADPKKISTIVHGIDSQSYADLKLERKSKPQLVAFVGRVAPIKDVKTFIRACKLVKDKLPWVKLLAVGTTEEDPQYYQECLRLTRELGLDQDLKFIGHINFKEFLAELDLLVLTSISEAQPLVILEAGAAGIPAVATHVGGCSQLINGTQAENPPLGPGGIVTPLADPEATASAIIKLLTDHEFYNKCSENIAKRIEKYYVFSEEHARYRSIYNKYLKSRN